MLTSTTIEDGVAVVRLDDGKANAVSNVLIADCTPRSTGPERTRPRCASSGVKAGSRPGSTSR
jgi:hypothetical protein